MYLKESQVDPATYAEAVSKSMTERQFLAYASDMLFGESTECLYDGIAEATSEIAMFGDAGPGALYRLRLQVQEYNSIADRYSYLTGTPVRHLTLPYPR